MFSKHIISVSKAGDADCTTINEAVVVAPPGATIVIDEGIYEEAILITKPLILTGKEGKCVGVHHPSFDVLKIENTEVEINNINIGVAYAERSIALNQARLIMRRCRVKNAKDLVNDGIDYSRADAPSTALETDGRAQGGSLSANRVTSQRIDDNPQNASWIFEVRKNVDEAPICIDSRTALTLIDCELEYVFVVSKGGSIVFNKVFMHCCSVTALEHSNISVSECTTRSNRHNAAVFICDNSIIAIERTTLSQVYTTGVLCCNDAEVTFKESKIEGIYQARRDPCPKPPVVMPNKSEYEYPSGFVLSEKVQIVMDQATLTGLRCGVLITRTSTGHVVIRNSSISYNENGVLTGYSFSVFDDSKKHLSIGVYGSEISANDKDGIRLKLNNNKDSFLLSSSKIIDNNDYGLYLRFPAGGVESCEFSGNGTNLYCGPVYLISRVFNCKGVGESTLIKCLNRVIRFFRQM